MNKIVKNTLILTLITVNAGFLLRAVIELPPAPPPPPPAPPPPAPRQAEI